MCKDIETRLETVGNPEVKKELLLKQIGWIKRAKESCQVVIEKIDDKKSSEELLQ
jgi:hypothetical protein